MQSAGEGRQLTQKLPRLPLPCPHSLHYRTSTGWAFPRKAGRTYPRKPCVVYSSIKTLLLALRIPECSKKPLRAVEPKTKLWTGCSSMGFRELLYQSSCSAILHVYIHLFIFISFKHLHYSRLCCNKNTAFDIHSSDREISLKMLALMKNTTCKLHPT